MAPQKGRGGKKQGEKQDQARKPQTGKAAPRKTGGQQSPAGAGRGKGAGKQGRQEEE